MKFIRTIRAASVMAGYVIAFAALAGQPSFRIVSYMYQWGPPIGLTEGSPGIFYSFGGSAQQAAFSMTTQGTKLILATFPTSTYIQAPLVSAADQRFYSALAPSFSVFSVSSTPGKQVYQPQAIVPEFTQNLPSASLLAVGAGRTTFYLVIGTLKGTVTSIYSFPSGERLPHSAMLASDGNYYGVSYLNDGSGYVFRITPSGSLTKIHTFPSSTFVGNPAYVPLLQASDGHLYGATPNGGTNGTGTIYKLTLGGQYTSLYSFPSGLDYNPTALIQASDRNLYGTTLGQNGHSVLFEITTAGQYTQLYQMLDVGCLCLLTQGSDGIIYGTAQVGGPVGGGAVWALNAGLPKPTPWAQQFSPQSGAAGTQVRIWGYNLLGATVQFNGTLATTVTNSGSNYIFATVPTGATTGPIMVTTPGGTMTTKANFTVQ
jgi:uncharacterized repeat protein (TIGR03803 family)